MELTKPQALQSEGFVLGNLCFEESRCLSQIARRTMGCVWKDLDTLDKGQFVDVAIEGMGKDSDPNECPCNTSYSW